MSQMRKIVFTLLLFLISFGFSEGQEERDAIDPGSTIEPTAGLEAALERLKLPGIRINLEERCLDVEGEICLDEGMLELVACTKGSKEHESIIAIDAKAVHIHTALLLLGTKQGTPAMQKLVGGAEGRWIDIPPSGGKVDVFLVTENSKGKLVERPISDFIIRSDPAEFDSEPLEKDERAFPTHTFLFAGSQLSEEGGGPRKYLADLSGNAISVATFGDELLCLPEVHSSVNGSLIWQANSSKLPKVGTKITLRLRPKFQ